MNTAAMQGLRDQLALDAQSDRAAQLARKSVRGMTRTELEWALAHNADPLGRGDLMRAELDSRPSGR